MDIPRKSAARNKLIRRIIVGTIVVVTIPLISMALMRLKPAAPSVERNTVWIDTVKRGPMLRQVRGLGSLIPEEIVYVPATQDGRVERIHVLAGTIVRADTVIIELSNPELQQQTHDAEWGAKAAEADLLNLRAQLESQRLNQRSEAARIQSEYHQAKLQADRDSELFKQGLMPDLNYRLSKVKADELDNRQQVEKERLSVLSDSIEAQIAASKTKVEQARALWRLRQDQLKSLSVRAGISGVLQQVPVQVGQRVTPGTNLAIVVEPTKLKAELKIPETQTKDILIGQRASIDTRNGVIPGVVSRIDPAAREGTVLVDVKLEGELPRGARPDLTVDGTVELERLDDVLYVGRPTFGQSDSTITIFRLVEGTKEAIRVPVKLGRSSVNTIEILEGLSIGDQVILSDMSQWDGHERVVLN
jgi:HlyD family secretion protein